MTLDCSESSRPAEVPQTRSCGCSESPKRICDLCYSARSVFLACSRVCLDRHQREQHPAENGDAEARARAAARAYNRRFPDSWQRYAQHRQRVMALIAMLPQDAEICVLGAGNCSDLDLDRLAGSQREVHLVDLDGEALERSRERQSRAVRDKIVLHPNVDFSGLLQHLDDWGERFPDRAELGRSAVSAAQRILHELGRSFAGVVSTCVLSQLAVPFQHAWVSSRANWADLLSALSAVHLATLAGSTRSGGRGLLVFDVASSKDTPELAQYGERASGELPELVAGSLARGTLTLRPRPEDLLSLLSSPGLRPLVSETELGAPWLWDLGDATQLVYSLSFVHP